MALTKKQVSKLAVYIAFITLFLTFALSNIDGAQLFTLINLAVFGVSVVS